VNTVNDNLHTKIVSDLVSRESHGWYIFIV